MPYDNNLTGVLFRNKKKEEGDKKPEYTGSCEIAGVEYWISAWVKTSSKTGEKFFSFKFEPKEKPADTAYSEPDPFDPFD
ncbi:MAG: hypothetical protein WC114_02710 [Smithellaceae bacterium]|jgi:hypothetical protein